MKKPHAPEKTQKIPIVTLLTRAVFILLAVLPFLLGTLAAGSYFSAYGRYKLISLASWALFFGMLVLMLRYCAWKMSDALILISLFASAVVVRALSQAFFNTQPISDYMDAINEATAFLGGPMRSLETARFPYWGFYRITLTTLFHLFSPTIETVKSFNLLLSGLTAVCIYLLGKKMTGARKFGALAALIYVIDPANLLYINMPTAEHIFVLLFPIAILVFMLVFDHTEPKMTIRIVMALGLGIVIGLMDIYKPMVPVLLIAMGITLALTEWMGHKATTEKDKRRKQIVMHALLIAVMLISYLSTKQLCFSTIEHYALIPPNRHGIGWTLRVGLNMENMGRVSAPLAYRMSTMYYESGENYKEVNTVLVEEALAQIKDVPVPALAAFVRDKFTFTWQSNQDFYNWATNTQIETGLMGYDGERLRLLGDPLNDAFLVFSLLLSAVGAGYSAVKRKDKGTLVVGLFILGFSLLLLVVEIQQRYRSVLASTIPFFAAYGLCALGDGMARIEAWVRKVGAEKGKG